MNLLLMQMLAALLYSSITDRIYSYAWFPPISISFIQLALGQARLFNYTPAPSFICWNLVWFSWKCSSLDCAAMMFIPYYKPAGWSRALILLPLPLFSTRIWNDFIFEHTCTDAHSVIFSLSYAHRAVATYQNLFIWSVKLKTEDAAICSCLCLALWYTVAAFVNSERHMVWLCIWILREASSAI